MAESVVPRRRALLEVDARVLVEMCKAGAGLRVTHDPIPDDAEAVGARYDAVRDLWEIALESRAFAAVGEGRAYPVLPPPRFERIGP